MNNAKPKLGSCLPYCPSFLTLVLFYDLQMRVQVWHSFLLWLIIWIIPNELAFSAYLQHKGGSTCSRQLTGNDQLERRARHATWPHVVDNACSAVSERCRMGGIISEVPHITWIMRLRRETLYDYRDDTTRPHSLFILHLARLSISPRRWLRFAPVVDGMTVNISWFQYLFSSCPLSYLWEGNSYRTAVFEPLVKFHRLLFLSS